MCIDLWKLIFFGFVVRKNFFIVRYSLFRNILLNVCIFFYLSLYKLIDLVCIRGGEDFFFFGRWGLIFFECE